MKIIKKLYVSILNINKEYLLLFVVVSALGLLIYSSQAVSQTGQDITITTFFPAPFGQFAEVRAKKYRDFDDPGNYFIDPSFRSQLKSLRVRGAIVTNNVAGPGGTYTFNLSNGNATLHDVSAVRFIQRDPGPPGPALINTVETPDDGTDPNTIRGVGKFIYGTNDIAEGVLGSDCVAGDVVLISDDEKNDVMISSVAFDARVAGVISGDPKIYMGRGKQKIPLALAGIVKCKATTENGSIKRGDLLVSASIPGHAMRADPQEIHPGMLIGKAMQPLKKETGQIYILVNKK